MRSVQVIAMECAFIHKNEEGERENFSVSQIRNLKKKKKKKKKAEKKKKVKRGEKANCLKEKPQGYLSG